MMNLHVADCYRNLSDLQHMSVLPKVYYDIELNSLDRPGVDRFRSFVIALPRYAWC